MAGFRFLLLGNFTNHLLKIPSKFHTHTNFSTEISEQTIENFAANLQECTTNRSCTEGAQIHSKIVAMGISDKFLDANLVCMYSLCEKIREARQVFDKMRTRDSFVYNIMIRAYASKGPWEEPLRLYSEMHSLGMNPGYMTFPSVLKACAALEALGAGRAVHGCVCRLGLELDLFIGNALVTMYAKCGKMDQASEVFNGMSWRDVVSWNAMIAGYAQNGRSAEAIEAFHGMERNGLEAGRVSVISVLPACAALGAIEEGEKIHRYVTFKNIESDPKIATALLDMYAKCGRLDVASDLFKQLSPKSVVSWNAMIAGYAQGGLADQAIEVFNEMQKQSNVRSNHVTFVSLLQAFGDVGALQQGIDVHDYLVKNSMDSDINVGNSLISMYGKCGCLDAAKKQFDKMLSKDVVTWNTMIAAYGRNGHGKDALGLFKEMLNLDVKPDNTTFNHVLSTCSHAGLVTEGIECFDSMQKVYGIKPQMEHYACMVDLLGRAGFLRQAWDLVQKMTYEPNIEVWGALLGACKIHGDVDFGIQVAECVMALKPRNAGIYVLLSNVYAAAGRWDDVAKVREVMKSLG